MTLSTGRVVRAGLGLGMDHHRPGPEFLGASARVVIAAARFMPGVCAVLMSSSFECTTRTPWCFHWESELNARLPTSRAKVLHGEEHEVFVGQRLDRVHHVRRRVDQRAGDASISAGRR